MKALKIRTEINSTTVDGVSYHFTRNKIEYSIFRMAEGITDIWKRNNQLGTLSSDCFLRGKSNTGKPMAKFLQQTMELIG